MPEAKATHQLQRLNSEDKWVPSDLKWCAPIVGDDEALAITIHLNSLSGGKYLGPNAKRYRTVKLGWG